LPFWTIAIYVTQRRGARQTRSPAFRCAVTLPAVSVAPGFHILALAPRCARRTDVRRRQRVARARACVRAKHGGLGSSLVLSNFAATNRRWTRILLIASPAGLDGSPAVIYQSLSPILALSCLLSGYLSGCGWLNCAFRAGGNVPFVRLATVAGEHSHLPRRIAARAASYA